MQTNGTRTNATQESPQRDDGAVYPRHPQGLPPDEIRTRRYTLRFARDERDLEAIQRLRYRVFNEELNEGLAASRETGLDRDPYDARCHHLIVVETDTGEAVGTYRLMTRETAYGQAFYSDSEYYLAALPSAIASDAVEAGRACVAADHRNGRVIRMLFAGLARYLAWNQKRYLFGCCSVPTLAPADMYALLARLQGEGRVDTEILLAARPHVHAPMPPLASVASRLEQMEPPALMTTYLRLGARVISEPAFDRDFGVSDLMVLLDVHGMDPRVLASLTSVGAARAA
ncbi:MAG: GNAT family N-acyltransferase [Polyangiales bacterium]|nr:GNAT family N-acetyltransferase [Myxococcales bacterium]MCB9657172.1 GNAT family N-acetyltransferase [Sandaracinaceae bacterium]